VPDYAEAHSNMGWLLKESGRFDEAAVHFRESIRLKPGLVMPRTGLAWILATHPDPGKRDAAKAVTYGTEGAELSEHRDWMELDALAAAFAAAGRFPDAVGTEQRAIEMARSAGSPLIGEMSRRLALYRENKAYVVTGANSAK
jgi:tetratricopeptide (TPR) repeat protein